MLWWKNRNKKLSTIFLDKFKYKLDICSSSQVESFKTVIFDRYPQHGKEADVSPSIRAFFEENRDRCGLLGKLQGGLNDSRFVSHKDYMGRTRIHLFLQTGTNDSPLHCRQITLNAPTYLCMNLRSCVVLLCHIIHPTLVAYMPSLLRLFSVDALPPSGGGLLRG